MKCRVEAPVLSRSNRRNGRGHGASTKIPGAAATAAEVIPKIPRAAVAGAKAALPDLASGASTAGMAYLAHEYLPGGLKYIVEFRLQYKPHKN